MLITIDTMGITRDEVLAAIREMDREHSARAVAYPRLIDQGKLHEDHCKQRNVRWAMAREIVACVARGMLCEGQPGVAVRVLPEADESVQQSLRAKLALQEGGY